MRWRRRRPEPEPIEIEPWGAGRAYVLVCGVLVAGLALLFGLGYSIYTMVGADAREQEPASAAQQPGGADLEQSTADIDDEQFTGAETLGDARRSEGDQKRDELAAAPMYAATEEDYLPQEPSRVPAETITVPVATDTGPVQVATGFPQTPEGAVGQLAAITTTVISTMDIRHANEVYDAWAEPGGVGGSDWLLTYIVQQFLADTSAQTAKPATTTVVATPKAAMVKAVDGPDWVVVCVLIHVRATMTETAEIAYGHCERMTWDGDRWVIAAGDPAALAPSTWPGTDVAHQAGWREIQAGGTS